MANKTASYNSFKQQDVKGSETAPHKEDFSFGFIVRVTVMSLLGCVALAGIIAISSSQSSVSVSSKPSTFSTSISEPVLGNAKTTTEIVVPDDDYFRYFNLDAKLTTKKSNLRGSDKKSAKTTKAAKKSAKGDSGDDDHPPAPPASNDDQNQPIWDVGTNDDDEIRVYYAPAWSDDMVREEESWRVNLVNGQKATVDTKVAKTIKRAQKVKAAKLGALKKQIEKSSSSSKTN